MRSLPYFVSAQLFAAILAGHAGAQAARVPDVSAELVRLDAVVTDAHGELVRDLTRDDFLLLEDGKPQRVTNFLIAGTPPVRPAQAAAPQPDAAVSVEPAPEADAETSGPGRGIVIVIDDLHMSAQSVEPARQALRRFVDELTGPQDSLALVAISGSPVVQTLTRDRAVLKQAINRLSARTGQVAAARNSQITPGQAELILRGDRNARLLAGRTMINEPGSILDTNTPRAAAEAPPGLAPTTAATSIDPETKDKFAEAQAERQARAILGEALRFSVATLGTTEAVLRSLAPLSGRKLCLLVSDGFLVGAGTSEGRERDLQRIVDAATRSGAVVYALDPRGLTTGADASVAGSGVPPGLQSRVDRQVDQLQRATIEGLAEQTGGFLIRGSNDLDSGLGRMLRDNEAYYLLAYAPTNNRRDGRFRKISLKVPAHSDYTVRTRSGYFALDERKGKSASNDAAPAPTALISPPLIDEVEARAALGAPLPERGPLRLTADYVEVPPAGPQGVVRAHVDLAGLHWKDAAGRRQATLELLGGLYDADGKPIGAAFGKRTPLDLTAGEFKRATVEGLRYQQQLALEPGRYQVRLLAREPHGAPLGGAEQWLDVPDLSKGDLALSGLFLSSSNAAGAAPQDASAVPELRDAQALRRFKRSETLYFQLYVYNPRRDPDGASDVVLQAQVRSGDSLVAASKPQPVAFKQQDALPLPETNSIPLQTLAPGSYELRIVVADRKADASRFRQIDFTVE